MDGETLQLSPEAQEVFCLLSDVERYIRANMRPPAKGPLQRLKEACSHRFLAGGRKSKSGR